MNKREYWKYLQSPEWANTRQRRLVVAGSRCEFRECLGDDWHPKHGFRYSERCRATRDLQVHHLRYDTLGAERDCDLEVLCRFHHLVRHVATVECVWCGEPIVTDDSVAIEIVKDAIASASGDIRKVRLDDVYVSNSINGEYNLCDYCESKLDD